MTTSRERRAGLLSRLFIQWPSALVDIGTTRPVELSDSLEPPPYDHLDRVKPAFEKAYAARRTGADGLRRALYDTYRARFWGAAVIFLVYQVCATAGPLLIQALIAWFEGAGRGAVAQGLLIAAGLGAFHVVESLAHKHQWSEAWKSAQSITALLRTQVLGKYLRMDRGARLAHPSGEVITLVSSDAVRVGQTSFFHMAWSVPLGIAGSATILCVLLGWAGAVGIVVLVAGLALSAVANNRLYALVPKIREANGVRIGLVSDLLAAMRTLRSHGWEQAAEQAVTRERSVLNTLLVGRQKRLATLYLVNAAAPVLMVTTTLVTYAALGNPLRAADVFAAIAVLTVLRAQLPELVRYLDMRNEWRVALGKVTTFLEAPDATAAEPSSAAPGTVVVSGASFAWPGAESPCLDGIDLRIEPGELVCVLGAVGSGKSAFLGALAGSMRTTGGSASVSGSVVHLPQRPWIMQATIESNIRCFAQEDPARYAEVLRATALDADLTAMPARDATLIGDRGATLSGGQRQRVALARAAYEDADVYLVDDPASAVDDAVAGTILDRLLRGVLAGRTVVVATHRLDYARRADRVVVLDEGRVVASGAFDEVAVPALLPASEVVAQQDIGPVEVVEPAEPVRTGTIAARTYRGYLRVLTPGWSFAVLVALALLGEGVLSAASVWLGWWTDRPGGDTALYAAVFAGIGLLALVLDRALFTFGFSRGVRAGMTLHSSMTARVLRAPMSFFDRTPSGRVLTRFSSDIETIDLELPEFTMDTLKVVVGFVLPSFALAVMNPLTLLFSIPVVVVYLRWQKRTRSSTVEASRLSKQAREPVLSLLTEAVDGVTSIEGRPARTAGYEREFLARVRTAHHVDYTVNSLSRHFNLRLDLLGALVLVGFAGMLVVETGLGAGLAGAGITFAYALIGTLATSLITIRMMDLALASFERVDDYTRLDVEPSGGAPAPDGWPRTGDVRFEEVTLRYAPGRPPALDDVSFHAPAGEKVGIVGRTGSGKSTTFAALMRFVECSAGRILVDGVDIASLRLRDLRAAIAVVPQDPVLLPGTLRDNLDPFRDHDDAATLSALEKVGLKLPGLDHPAADAHLSAGERQLFCLARALLHRTRIVLIDEATSNLDAETDARVQRVLDAELAGATVLCIAHRRDTLLGADRVVTLDAGRVASVVTPERTLTARGARHG
ncbi:ATP-binding cassette domain-containing protein [Lentzea sp. NPDC058436]|uniref:ATP-binding cassette domain-containing protein n=1 Tax=Lentzea sp. NPDC058436 TaxID=3346499 RepID=UPI00366515AD